MNHFSYRPAPDKLLWSASWLGQLRWGVVLLLITLSVRVNAQTAPASITVTGGCLGGTYVLNKFADPYENTNRPAYRGIGAFTLTPQSGSPTTYSNETVDVYYVPSASKWVLSTGGLIALSNASTSAQPPTTGWVTETNAQFGNCNQTTPFNAATGTASVTPTVVAAVCVGSPVSFTATSTNLTSPVSYTWSSSPAGFSGSGNVFTQNAPNVGSQTTFTVSVTAIASGGAQRAIASASVTVKPAPTITVGVGSNPTSCGGTNGSIAFTTANLPDGSYSLSYTGTGTPKNVTVSGNAFTLTGLPAGNYSNFSVTNNGCTGSVATTRTLSDPPAPILTVGAATSTSTCGAANGSIAFTTANLGNGNYTLNYTGPSGASSKTVTVASNAFSLTGLSAGSYSNFSITNNGCTGSAATARTVSDPAQPIASVSANQTLCTGTSATLSATATNGTGVWSVLSGPSTASAQFNNTASASASFTPAGGAGTYTLLWTVTSGNCTPATADVTVTVNLQPTLTLGAGVNPASCGGNSGSIAFTTNLPDGLYSLTYTGTGSPKTVTVNSGTFSLTGLSASSYSNFAISNNGCTGSTATSRTLSDPPTPTLTVGSATNPTSCSGTNGNIAFTTTNLPDGPYSLSYTGAGSPKTITVSGNAFSLTGLSAGSYSNFAITNNGCTGSAATSRTLSDPAAPTLTLGASVNPTTCGGAEGSIAFTTANLPDGPYSLSYTGTGNPKTITVSGNAFSLTGLTAGTYSNFSISNNGCLGSVATSRTLSGPLQPTLTVANTANPSTCGAADGSIGFTTNLPNGPYSLTYTGAGSPKTITVTGGAFSLTGLSAGIYSSFSITSNGCVGSTPTSTTLSDPAQPIASVGANQSLCTGTTATLSATATNGTGVWSVVSGPSTASSQFSNTASASASFTPAGGAGTYTLRWTVTSGNCTPATAELTVTVNLQPTLTLGTPVSPATCGGATGSIAFTTNLPDGPYSLSYTGAGSPRTVTVSGGAFTLAGLTAGSYSNFAISNNGCTGSVATSRTLSDPAAPTLTLGASVNPTTCGGAEGSIAFTTTNLPDGPYSLTYTGTGSPKIITVSSNAFSLTGLAAGTYSNFAISNNGCIGSVATARTLSDPLQPTLTVGSATNPTTCGASNGSIAFTTTNLPDGPYSLTYTGADSPKVVSIIGGAFSLTGLVAGSYSNFAIGNNGCVGSAATTRLLSDPGPVLTVGSSTDPTTCGASNGGIAFTVTNLPDGPYSLTYSGAGSPQTVTVSSGAFSLTGLPAGSYSNFAIGNNGCIGSAATTRLLSDPGPTLTVGSATNPTTCGASTGSIAFTTTNLPDGPYSLTYTGAGSPKVVTVISGAFSLTGLVAGSYSNFAIGNNGCVGSAATTRLLSDPAAPMAGLINNGPFSCTTVSITLTASGGVSYAFSSGAAQIGGSIGSTATVTSAGTYSVIVTGANGCTASASTTVGGSNDVPPSPDLSSRTVSQNSGDLTLTATNCSGTLNWTGPASTSGTGSIVVPTSTVGSFIYSATCVLGACSSTPTNFTITVTPAGNQPLQLVTPLYNCRTGSITFQTLGGNGSLIEYRAVGVTDWSPNPSQTVDAALRADVNSSGLLQLMARQNGTVVMLDFDFRAFCAGSNGNQPPQVMVPIANQQATQGSGFSFTIPAGTFTDPENQTLTLSVQGLPSGLTFTGGNTISGTPTQSGTFPLLLTATDPGGLSANTTFQLIVAPSGAVQPLVLIEPLYNCQTGAITFRTTGGDGSLIEYRAVGVTDWSPNPSQTVDAALREDLGSSSVLTLMARQNGVMVTLAFDFRAFCQNVPINNLPPVFHGPLASQLGTQGQAFSYQIPQAAFSDPENGLLTYAATGLPAGLSFTAGSRTISGTPTQAGSFTVTITATDPQNASISGQMVLVIEPTGTGPLPLQLVTPLYNCQTGAITFQTTGGDGSLIEFRAVGVTDWSASPNHTVDAPLRQDLNSSPVLTLMARQNGTIVMLNFDFRAFCAQGGRLIAKDSERQPLQVTVLGNPVVGEQVEVDIKGAQGQPLQLVLTDTKGHSITDKSVPVATGHELHTLKIGRSVGGLLLLRVSTPTQQQVIKVVVR
ncbi:putative Ig domain-containing protein [Spirosoma soli]|uniref:Ig domain-containing protein n=1 Tax=Spirosoma soli TaxID=1770529 RepID=A0ABW5LWN3_9BACT